MPEAEARALLARAPYVHLAAVTPAGAPILRAVHVVVLGDCVYFHGAPAGEKLAALGAEVVLTADEIVAELPSYFSDPERACPATTLYRSAQLHGRLEAVEDPDEKAAALQALMRRYQPEGGHAPITASDPRYARAVRGVLVCRVRLGALDGKAKLAQNRDEPAVRGLLERLWARGRPGDPVAIERIRAAHPSRPTPAFLAAPAGFSLHCAAIGEGDAAAAAALLDGTYWNEGISRDALVAVHAPSHAWVCARDAAGALVATARALSDGRKNAWIYDVVVAPGARGRGLGQALVRLLLDHPALRHVRRVRLDAHSLYARLGFVETNRGPGGRSEMTLQRSA